MVVVVLLLLLLVVVVVVVEAAAVVEDFYEWSQALLSGPVVDSSNMIHSELNITNTCDCVSVLVAV
jgi:hypothetical protein